MNLTMLPADTFVWWAAAIAFMVLMGWWLDGDDSDR